MKILSGSAPRRSRLISVAVAAAFTLVALPSVATADPEPAPSADILWDTNARTLIAETGVLVPVAFAERTEDVLYDIAVGGDGGALVPQGDTWGNGPGTVLIVAPAGSHSVTLALSFEGTLVDTVTFPVVDIDLPAPVSAPADLTAVPPDPEFADAQVTHTVISTRGGTAIDQPTVVTWPALGIPMTATYAVYSSSGVRVAHGLGVANKAKVEWKALSDGGTLVPEGQYILVIVASPQRSFPASLVTSVTVETPVAPSAPNDVSARASVNRAKVYWQPPTDDGGQTPTGYTATATPGGQTCTTNGAARSCYVPGLTNGQAYTFQVTAANSAGSSLPSSASNSVTPSADTTDPVMGATSVTPSRVSSLGGNVVVDVAASDDISGVKTTGTIIAVTFEKAGSSSFGFTASFTRISGDEYDGVYRVTVPVPAGTPAGVWDLVVYPITDAAGNTSSGFVHRPGVLIGTADAPTNVITTTLPGRQVKVDWTPPASDGGNIVTGYKVTDSFTNTTTTVMNPTYTGTYPTIPNDTPLTFTVVAVNAGGDSPPVSSAPVALAAVAPSAPATASAAPGNSQAVITWSAPASSGGAAISGYTVTSTPGDKTCTGGWSATSCTVTGLTNGTSYTFSVVATNSAGDSPGKATNAVTVAGVPDKVLNLTGTAEDGAVSLSWTAPANNGSPITGYRIVEVDGAMTPLDVAASSTTAVRSGLTNGASYKFTVVAVNGAGYGPVSDATSVLTPVGAPIKISGVKAARGDRRATITWPAANPNGASVTGYTVTLSPGGKVLQLPASARSVVMIGLTNGVNYTAAVTATNAIGTSPASVGVKVVPAGRPGQVARPRVVVKGHTVTVSWTAAFSNGSPITAYKITGVTATAKIVRGSTVKFVFRNVKPGVHKIRITALNTVGWGPASTIRQVTVRR